MVMDSRVQRRLDMIKVLVRVDDAIDLILARKICTGWCLDELYVGALGCLSLDGLCIVVGVVGNYS